MIAQLPESRPNGKEEAPNLGQLDNRVVSFVLR